jgi:hypothetical protein
MGNFVAVPSFNRKRKSSRINIDQTSLDTQPSSTERESYHVYYNTSTDLDPSLWIAIKNRRKRTAQTNRIRTTRYNILTFLPKNLFEQFHRIANIYFAILIGLNWIPIINAISKTVNDIFGIYLMHLFVHFYRLLFYH